ncbi:MAG: spermidine synthase [Thermoplasmata archaeon]
MQNLGKWKWKKFLWKHVLEYDGTVYSMINEKNVFAHGYWDLFIPFFYLFQNPDVLLIGLGGGTIIYEARKIFNDKVNIETVEIDEDSVKMASKFLKLKNEKITIGDGFDFVMGKINKYDIIILDAYEDRRIPQKFISENFFLGSYNALKEKGFLLINYALNGYGILKINDLKNFADEYFETFKIGTTIIENNMIIVCSKNITEMDVLKKFKSLDMPRLLKRRVLKIKTF